MKIIITLSIPIFVVLHCFGQSRSSDESSDVKNTVQEVTFRKVNNIFVLGDFDGDGHRKDTIFQHVYSGVTKHEIERAPDPFENDLIDIVQRWYYDQEADVQLTSKSASDTLHLGLGYGLYCLINIGDNNTDGKDEIALVVAAPDFSNVNVCNIYTLCNGSWSLMKSFSILEYAFFTRDEKNIDFQEIKEYLERKNGQWFYLDHEEYMEDENKKLQPLKISRCH